MSWLFNSKGQQSNGSNSPATPALPDGQQSIVPVTNPGQRFSEQSSSPGRPEQAQNADETSNANPEQDPETRASARHGHSIAPLPDHMSCRQAFDEAVYCSFLGAHFNNLYRYGQLRECSEKWSDFWFCARMRSYPDLEKKQMIRDRYRQKEERYMTGPSSEDVWEARTRPVDKAFHLDPDEAGVFEKPQKRS